MARRPVATGYVDLGASGRTELRIHGVGGTSPQELLDHPHPVQVAGDATSGFYRRWAPDGAAPDGAAFPEATSGHHVEGFSWGGMTSGSARRALWLLLIPFLLVNVAHWALPGRAAKLRWANTAAQRLVRLLALSLTMTLVLAAAEIGIDLLGRQCGGTNCIRSAPAWLNALAGHRAAAVCVGALIPLATIALLGYLGRSTWKITEKVDPQTLTTQGNDPTNPDDPALADPQFWAGAEPVRRLWAVHVATALSSAAVIQILPALDGGRAGLAIATLAAAGIVLLIAAVAVVSDGVARPHHRRWSGSDISAHAPRLAVAGAVVFAAALVVDLIPRAVQNTPPAARVLDGLNGIVQALYGAQAAMVILLAAFVWIAGLQPSAVQAGRRHGSDQLIAPALVVLAWLTAWFFTAGLTVRVAQQLFGKANNAVPPVYTVFAAIIPPGGGLILVGLGIWAFRWYRAEVSRQRTRVGQLPPPAGPTPGGSTNTTDTTKTDRTKTDTTNATKQRISTLASVRARASLLDLGLQLVVVATGVCVVLATAGLLVAVLSPNVMDRPWVQRLADLGTVLLGIGVVRLLAVARSAWRQVSTRRSVGILWDLGTFWPRAAHPLAPPCYCERALPQLHERLTFFGAQSADGVVIAGHSQGSVIAAALMLMPRTGLQATMSLLTYGCPLGRLYARAFPGYLGPQILGVGAQSSTVGDGDPAPAIPTVLSESSTWLNLYRETDPIGGFLEAPVTGPRTPAQPFGSNGALKTGKIDVVLVDPDFGVPPGDIFPPAAAGHSHYREDVTYDIAVDQLLSAGTARHSSERQPQT